MVKIEKTIQPYDPRQNNLVDDSVSFKVSNELEFTTPVEIDLKSNAGSLITPRSNIGIA